MCDSEIVVHLGPPRSRISYWRLKCLRLEQQEKKITESASLGMRKEIDEQLWMLVSFVMQESDKHA